MTSAMDPCLAALSMRASLLETQTVSPVSQKKKSMAGIVTIEPVKNLELP